MPVTIGHQEKRADHPADSLSVAASRIAYLHARLQFFSAALFIDGPRYFPGVVR